MGDGRLVNDPRVIPYATADRRLAHAVRDFTQALDRLTFMLNEAADRLENRNESGVPSERQQIIAWAAQFGVRVPRAGNIRADVKQAWALQQAGDDDAAREMLLPKPKPPKERKIRAPREPRPPRPKALGDRAAYLAKVREWARNNGFDVKPMGRVPVEVWLAYNDAHPLDSSTESSTGLVVPDEPTVDGVPR